MPEDPASSPARGEGEDEAPEDPQDPVPSDADESAPDESGPDAPAQEESPEKDVPGEGIAGDEAPLRNRVPWWSPIGADTSDVPPPDPEEIDVRTPLLLFLAPIVILAIGSLVARDLVWDRFLFPFVWEPIVLDAGFNLVNTALWALLLGLLLFLSYRLVQKIGQPVDMFMVFAVLPYMLGGAIVRVMEDTGYFGDPLRFLFITPIIYVLIFGVAVVWLLIGYALRRQSQAVGKESALRSTAGLFGVIWVLYFAWSLFGNGDLVSEFGSPWVLLFAFIVPLAYFWFHTRQSETFSQVGVMAAFGTAFMLFALYMLVLWHSGAQWEPLVDKPLPADPENNLWVYPLMIVAPAILAGIAYAIGKMNMHRWDNFFVFMLPINLAVIFGQALDAVMTSVGVDFLGYGEKHVLPGFLIEGLAGAGIPVVSDYAATFVMMIAKLTVAVLVVWLIDVYSRPDMVKYPSLVGLVKMAIIMVGLVPGTRNAIRMAMGV